MRRPEHPRPIAISLPRAMTWSSIHIEGRVVWELGVAIHRLADAKKVHPEIVTVSPGKAPRHVISRGVHPKKEPTTTPAPTPAPVSGGATPPAATNSTGN